MIRLFMAASAVYLCLQAARLIACLRQANARFAPQPGRTEARIASEAVLVGQEERPVVLHHAQRIG